MYIRFTTLILSLFIFTAVCSPQSMQDAYDSFKRNAVDEYQSHRNECNAIYADFLRSSWDWYQGKAPLPIPKETFPVPPRPYLEDPNVQPIDVTPKTVNPIENEPQPKPFEPIKEVIQSEGDYFPVRFYDLYCKVRLPNQVDPLLQDCSPNSLAKGWENLCVEEINNSIRDCLETRIRYNLCDWAYLKFLDELSWQYCQDQNGATLLMAFLYCQSGYQMRLAVDEGRLVMLFGSQQQIYDMGYFQINGINFYPYGKCSDSISICDAAFEGETPLSLNMSSEQLLGPAMSEKRTIQGDFSQVQSSVPTDLIKFYNEYPTAQTGDNLMTRWAMYANVPLAKKTQDILYPSLKNEIQGQNILTAVNIILNWVQTGFEYEYDDKVWGHDRAFFAEESLYYPYCDCEDRSILFSRLVRDLLGLDAALIYYPGHLATAVCFKEDVYGDTMLIDGRKFIVCDPTYIGAPVGAQMPDLEYDKAQAIVLTR